MTWADEMRDYYAEYGNDPDPVVVCLTHKRFPPCRNREGVCVVSTDPADVDRVRRYQQGGLDPDPLLTEAAGPVRCRDCGTTIERGDPCVDMRDGTGDVLCCACGDEAGMIL